MGHNASKGNQGKHARQNESGRSRGQGKTETQLARGNVKWFNEQKGYGFITPDDGGKDLFVHYSNIVGDGYRNLQDGQAVEYDAAQGRKGPEAQNVRAV